MLLVRTLLQLGPTAYGVVIVIGIGSALAATVLDIITTGLVPELAKAFHSGTSKSSEFSCLLSTSEQLCRRIAILVATSFCLLALATPFAGFPEELTWGVSAFLVAKGFEWLINVSSAPFRSACLVAENTATLNYWVVIERVADLMAAVLAVWLLGPDRPAAIIATYGLLGSLLTSVVSVGFILITRRQISESLGIYTVTDSSQINSDLWKSIRANSQVGIATSLYLRMPVLVIYFLIGTLGAYSFGLAIQFSFYLRQVAMGLVLGLDGVAARVSMLSDQEFDLSSFLRRSTRWQATLVLPVMIFVLIYTESLLQYWAGDKLGEQQATLAQIALLVRIMTIGVAARSLSEGWMRALAGAGLVNSFSRPMLWSAFLCPFICGASTLLAPEGLKLLAATSSLSVLLFCVQLVILPFWISHRTPLSIQDFYLPLLQPCLAAAAASTLMLSVRSVVPESLLGLVLTLLAFAVSYTALMWQTVLDRHSSTSVESRDSTDRNLDTKTHVNYSEKERAVQSDRASA